MRDIDYYDHPANTAAQTHAHRSPHIRPWHWLVMFTVTSAIALGSYWFATRFPDTAHDILITVDRFGITEAGAKEQQRVYNINHMDNITFEEKQVLIKRTIFFGATREMVFLALGNPVCAWRTKASGKTPSTEYWVYYIDNDRKPTQLAFQNNELSSASKASALDSCHSS